MRVHYFTVNLGDVQLEALINAISAAGDGSAPQPLPLEGGPIGYIFCSILYPQQLIQICDRLGCEVAGYMEEFPVVSLRHAFSADHVDAAHYNSEYCVGVQYFQAGKLYILEPKSAHYHILQR